jgi:heptosyltransferase-2
MTKPEKILLLPICGLGDAVCYVPYLRALRTHFPESEIVVVVATSAAASILKGNVENVEVIVFNRSEQTNAWKAPLQLLWQIRQRRFDVVVSAAPPNSVRVPIFAWLSGAKLRVGSKFERLSFLYNRRLHVQTDSHYVERYSALFASIGVTVSEKESSPRLRPPSEAKASAMRIWNEAGLSDAEFVIAMVSGADSNPRGRWQPYLKRWNNEGYAEVARWAARELDARVVMIGSAAESAIAENISQISGIPIVNLCGLTGLSELQWILGNCAAIVSNDTGTMHLAGALGVQVLSLFGPTSAKSFRPPGKNNRFIEGYAPCSPCYPHPTCQQQTCQAMNDIAPAQVIDGLLVMLNSRNTVAMSKD